MQISAKHLKEISESLQCGMKIFINRETYEIKEILDWDDSFSVDPFWDEEMEKVEEEWKDYSVIEKMESHNAFKIMESFTEEVADRRLKEDLIKILNRKSPFANFKVEVETSSYRQKWFDFRNACYIEYVKEQLEFEEIKFES